MEKLIMNFKNPFKKSNSFYLYAITTYARLGEEFIPCTAVWFDRKKYNAVEKHDLPSGIENNLWEIKRADFDITKKKLLSHLRSLFPREDNHFDNDEEKFTASHEEVSAEISNWLKSNTIT